MNEHTECAGRFGILLLIALLETFQVLLEILAESGREYKGLQYIPGGSYEFFCAFVSFRGFNFIFSGNNL